MSYHTEMKLFENSAAASRFLSLISHIRLYQGGGKAEAFNQEIKATATEGGNGRHIKLSEQQVIEIALKYREQPKAKKVLKK